MSLIITRNFKREKAQNAVARDAVSDELDVGDKIWITQYGRNYPYTITKKWKEGRTVWYKAKNDKSGKEEIVAGAFANALDAAAKDIQLPFIITFNNGKKEFREGYSEEEVRRRFDKSVAALYGGIKSVKLEGEDKRDGKDSIADKEREYTRLYELAQKNITFHATKGDSAKVAEWKRKADEYKRLAQEAENAAEARNAKDSRAADASGTDAKLQKGDKVRVWQQPVYGKLGEIVEASYGGMEYTVNVEGKDYPRIDYRRIVKVSNAASDAAELRVVHAKGIGKWWVEPNLSLFNDADREQTHKGRKEFPDREAAMKYARGTGKTFIVNDACDAMDANFKKGDKVTVKTKWAGTRKGIVKEVINDPALKKAYVVEIEGAETYAYPAEIVSADACEDSGELNNSSSAVAKDAYGVESKYYSGPFYPHLNDDGSIMEFKTEGEARKYIAEQERRDRMRSSSIKSYRVVRLNA